MSINLISIKEYCLHYKTKLSFIEELEELGLIHTLKQEDEKFIDEEQLSALESYNRMFYELELNIAGIEVVHHLLNKIKSLQYEINELKNQLNFYR